MLITGTALICLLILVALGAVIFSRIAHWSMILAVMLAWAAATMAVFCGFIGADAGGYTQLLWAVLSGGFFVLTLRA